MHLEVQSVCQIINVLTPLLMPLAVALAARLHPGLGRISIQLDPPRIMFEFDGAGA